MTHISFDDPAWGTTFPRIIAPLEDEWIVGLLLRCDKVNLWGSGLTLAYLINSTSKARLRRSAYDLTELHLQKLARALALPLAGVVATTYYANLTRLYEKREVTTCLAELPEPFRLCPACVAEHRLLRRILMLPGITHCPQHRTILVSYCQCGELLQPFVPSALPFTCHLCGLDWKELSQLPAEPEQIKREPLFLAFYDAFLKGSPEDLARALHILSFPLPPRGAPDVEQVDVLPLGSIVRSLVEGGHSPGSLSEADK